MTESIELFTLKRVEVKKFDIYQLEVPSVDPYLMSSHEEVQTFVDINKDSYKHTACIKKRKEDNIEKELEVLFTIGNSRNDIRLEILSYLYRSLSPGDIVSIEDNHYWCGTQGWLQISFM